MTTYVQVQTGLLVCDVYSGWAGPCHIMKPIITKLKSKVLLFQNFLKSDIAFFEVCLWLIKMRTSQIRYFPFDQLAMQRGKDLVQVRDEFNCINLKKHPASHSRLPCFVFFLCMLTTNKNPNANKLSWVIN